jgi:serine/threonine-protein kinase
MRVPAPAAEVATVVVLAPHRISGDDRQYLATAVHETVLARLAKIPRLRVLPRVGAPTDKPTFGIELDMQEQLEVWITLESGSSIFQKYPSGVENVIATAESIASTIEAELVRLEHRDDKLHAALDLFWQARHIAYRDLTRMPEAIDKLERARVLAPHDARIAATLAIAHIRAAFFRPGDHEHALEEARLLATAAVTAAPALADGHIALGHLELTSGQPVRAASHFRMAIARAPHLAEAHEQLGRMLLEAGYIDLGLARLDEAVAIAPDLRSAQWEITRAYALDERWDDVDRMIVELRRANVDRPLSRARYAWWRDDWDTVRELRAQIGSYDRVLWPGVFDKLFDVFLHKERWSVHQAALMAAMDIVTPNFRRRVFIAQLACEAAAHTGDADGVVELLEHATAHGLFDLHWLDRCVLLRPYCEVPGVMAVRKQIAARAEAILDALYGDHAAALSATQIA